MRALALALVVACSHAEVQHEPVREVVPAETIATETLATPLRSSRLWTTALAPRARGGWNFIAMAWELHAPAPPEYLVVDLETGTQTTSAGISEIYANTNYQVANEVRAANGRIFFPEADGHLAYYEPADERVHQLGAVVPDRLIFKLVFGPDGKLYGGTQASGLPTIFALDPATLAVVNLGAVGRDRLSFSYAYDLVVDLPWIYVAVGQTPWELAAVDTRTRSSKILAKRSDDPWIELEATTQGVAAKLISHLHGGTPVVERWWCSNGALTPTPPRRDVRPASFAPPDPPELEIGAIDSDGVGHIRSRAHPGAWRDTPFRVAATVPVPLESLVALPDGSLLGGASQYHGMFRYDPQRRTTQIVHDVAASNGVIATVRGHTYLAGYPNGVLYALDRIPKRLGNFAAAGAHYAELLVPGPKGRVYFAGRRERDGIGGGIGWYEPDSSRFEGHHERLSFLDPRGLISVGDRIVLSGAVHDDPAHPGQRPAEAQLVIYDAELRERERVNVRAGLQSTGELFAAGPNAVVGLVREARAIYRYDLAAHRLSGWVQLDAALGPATVAPDGAIWFLAGDVLTRVDPTTLALARFGKVLDLPAPTAIAWQRDELYAISGAELRRLVLRRRAIK